MERRRSQSPYSFTRFKTFKNMEQLEGAIEMIIGKEKKWKITGKPFCDKTSFFYSFSFKLKKCHAKFRKIISSDGIYAIDVEKLNADKKEVKQQKEKLKNDKKQLDASLATINNIGVRLLKQEKIFEEYCDKMQKAVLEEKEEMLAELKVLRGELKKMNVEIAEMKSKLACVDVMQAQLNELRARVDSFQYEASST
uniref:Uncharacterized protein n=2 Tax=Meloidogyne TaxID=189290 RepID=A0A6V7VXZ4_MELEN|nr:unnamed protein product [Meloidogyne enterolobii]